MMMQISKPIKKTENIFIPGQSKDITSLRKQVMNHEYYTTIESYLNDRYKRIKKSRRIITKQKLQEQQQQQQQSLYNNLILSQNHHLFNHHGIQQQQAQYFTNQGQLFNTNLSNNNNNNLDQLSLLQTQQSSNNRIPYLTTPDSLIINQGHMLQGNQHIQTTHQDQNNTINNNNNNSNHNSNHVNNYMKLDKVQLSVKKDKKDQYSDSDDYGYDKDEDDDDMDEEDNDDEDDDDSDGNDNSDDNSNYSDKAVYSHFSYIYSYIQNERKKDITIEHHDLKKLLPNQYLNDTIINFFLKFMEVEMLSDYMKEKVLIYNTYFMSKLAPNDQIDLLPSSSFDSLNNTFEKNYQALRRWIKEDIFEKDFLVFPLNLPEHWSVLIVCNHKRLFDSETTTTPSTSEQPTQSTPNQDNSNAMQEEKQEQNEKKDNHNETDKQRKEYNKPCLLYFDSFGLLDSKYANMIRLYLNKEFDTKKKSTVQKNIVYDETTLPSHQPLIPRQTNYVDCGLYLLEFTENFLNDPQKILSLFNSKKSEDWMLLKWFPRCNIHRKRKFIKQLLVDLSKLKKEEAVENYIKKRKDLLQNKQDNKSQYDEIDMNEFEDHIQDLTEYEDDYPETEEEKHRMLLDFYMNPTYNKYDVV